MEGIYLKDFPGIKLRVTLVREDGAAATDTDSEVKPLSNPECVYEYLRGGLEEKDRELFVVIPLNTKNVPLGVNLVAVGSVDSATVHPREVFKPAILASATSIILAHNHPSGDPQPSRQDKTLTHKLVEAGELLGIEVLDHIIVGRGRYYSLRDAGELRRKEE